MKLIKCGKLENLNLNAYENRTGTYIITNENDDVIYIGKCDRGFKERLSQFNNTGGDTGNTLLNKYKDSGYTKKEYEKDKQDFKVFIVLEDIKDILVECFNPEFN